jgi:hypothetical protein
MPTDEIRYDILTQDAMRTVMRTVLADVAARGLPGEHHFLVTFDTRAEGVRLSPRLKADFPVEITIVLQHRFWDLRVGADAFDVDLSFNQVREHLHVPFRAVKTFLDPSVQFGVQFAVEVDEAPQPETAATGEDAAPRAESGSAAPAAREEGAEVVSLDRFRKK